MFALEIVREKPQMLGSVFRCPSRGGGSHSFLRIQSLRSQYGRRLCTYQLSGLLFAEIFIALNRTNLSQGL